MAKVNWRDEFSVGIGTIDYQHKKLFEVINTFYDSLLQKQNKDAVIVIIGELRKYVNYHFTTEEKLLERHQYPDLIKHKQEHEKFSKQLAEFEEKVQSGKLLLSLQVTVFLGKWIKDHILETDQAYSRFLISKGVN